MNPPPSNLTQSIIFFCVYSLGYALPLSLQLVVKPTIVSQMFLFGYNLFYRVAVRPAPHLHTAPTQVNCVPTVIQSVSFLLFLSSVFFSSGDGININNYVCLWVIDVQSNAAHFRWKTK